MSEQTPANRPYDIRTVQGIGGWLLFFAIVQVVSLFMECRAFFIRIKVLDFDIPVDIIVVVLSVLVVLLQLIFLALFFLKRPSYKGVFIAKCITSIVMNICLLFITLNLSAKLVQIGALLLYYGLCLTYLSKSIRVFQTFHPDKVSSQAVEPGPLDALFAPPKESPTGPVSPAQPDADNPYAQVKAGEAPLVEVTPPVENDRSEKPSNCPHCGAPLEMGASVCPSCGALL